MNAHKYIKENGLAYTIEMLKTVPQSWCFAFLDLTNLEVKPSAPSHGKCIAIAELEQAASDFDLIKHHGGEERVERKIRSNRQSYKLTAKLQAALKRIQECD